MFHKLVNIFTYALVVISPFLSLINIKLNGASALKEAYQLTVLLALFLSIALSRLLVVDLRVLVAFLLVITFFISGMNVSDSSLFFDGLRFQVGYLAIFVLVLASSHMFDISRIRKLITSTYFIVVVIGLLEFFDDNIIKLLYGVDKEFLSNTRLAVGFRLISVFGNPINYSIFLCLGFTCFVFEFKNNRKLKAVMSILTLFLVSMTFSRSGLLVFVLLLIVLNVSNFKRGILFFCVAATLSSFVLMFFESDDKVVGGFTERNSTLLELSTFVENDRVLNWKKAFESNGWKEFVIGNGLGTSNPDRNAGGVLIENSFLSILFDVGVLGLTCYAILFSLGVYYAFKSGHRRFYILIFLTYFMFGLGNDIHRNFPFVFYFWLFLGCLYNEEFTNHRYINDRKKLSRYP